MKKWLSALLAVVLIFSLCLGDLAWAAGSGGMTLGADRAADSDYDGIPDQYDAAPDSNVFTGKLKSGHDGTTAVSFTMDFRNFFGDNTVYHPELATVSVMGAALAYYDEGYTNAYFTFDTAQTWAGGTASRVDGMQLMQVLGFEDVADYTLDSYGDDDLCEVVIGHRTVTYNGQTQVIVAIWVRGTDSKSAEEWSSNFHMGDLVRFFDAYDSVEGKSPRQSNDDWTRKTNHRGFDVCATRLLNYLKTYYLDEFVQPVLDAEPEAVLTYWLTGHSRGAAVANLMGSYLIDEGERVFDYTFAAPYNTANTEASAEKYDCIFNLVNANDFIPMLPMPEWGFTRYGKTAEVDASVYSTEIKNATGEDYSGKFLTASDMTTLLNKFICITGENADRNNPGKILGWREVYVYHCGHTHPGETVGNYQSTTVKPSSFLSGVTESNWNGYATRLKKYSYWNGGICQTPAYDLQVLVELLVQVAQGNTLGGGWNYLTSNKLADKFDFDKQSLINYASKLTEPHFMDTYSVVQAQINSAGDPGARFHTLSYYTDTDADGGRPVHTHTYTYVPYEGHEPTCTQDGFGYRYCLCSQADADFYDDYQKNVVIPATGHDWGEASYTWAKDSDGWKCTATRTCATCAETETETVAAVRTENGDKAVYTAVFTNEAFAAQVREAELAYYLVGTMTDWGVDAACAFAPNPAVDGEYMLAATLAVGDQVKVVRAEDGEILAWYPGGSNYTVVYATSGSVNVYFRPAGNYWNDFHEGGYFFISKLHTAAVVTDGNGTASIDPAAPDYTATVTVTATPDEGYHYDRTELFRKTGEGENDLEPVDADWNAETMTFTMPACDVVVKVYFAAHTWGEVSYVWADDNSACTAARTCSVCGREETETATASVETTPAACETEGTVTYTAAFENEAFQTQTKTETIPAAGHAWGEVTYVWADDNSACTAARTCSVCGHEETETVNTAAQTTPAACETDGETVYTAAFTNPAFAPQERTVTIPAAGHTPGQPVTENEIAAGCTTDGSYDTVVYCAVCGKELSRETVTVPAAGHAWGEPTYVWAEDNSTVTASRVCARDAAHVETETVNTAAQTTPAACETDGETVYTAAFTNPAFAPQERTVTIPAAGHTPGQPVTENEIAAGCTTDGSYDTVVYCAVCGKELSRETVTVPAAGHAWGEVTYVWADDNSACTAARTCSVCGHEETETATPSYEVVTEPTTESEGLGRYTAVFQNTAFESQTKDVVIPKLVIEGYHILVTDCTAGSAATGIDAEALYSGEVTFTVSCAAPCVVAVDNGNDAYTVLTCSTSGDEHSFTVTVADADVTIVIAVKGDANLNGAREAKDATFAAQAVAGKRTFTALQQLAMDGNGDGVFDSKDATFAAQVESGKRSYQW